MTRGLVSRALGALKPPGLLSRSLLITLVPMLVLTLVIGYVFMERHYDSVTRRLSLIFVRQVAILVSLIEQLPATPENRMLVKRLAKDRLDFTLDFLPRSALPSDDRDYGSDLLDRYLALELAAQIGHPFWIDTQSQLRFIETRIRLEDMTISVTARRSVAYASNWHIFYAWTLLALVVVSGVALYFMRSQIRPIQALAEAAEKFGHGASPDRLPERGAREVRRATQAFFDMRDRIEQQIRQRTTMLAGVSHDLRTLLTRFRLQLAIIGSTSEIAPHIAALNSDIDEMNDMLEDYLAFARGDDGEAAEAVDLPALLSSLAGMHHRPDFAITIDSAGWEDVKGEIRLRPRAIARCIANIIENAAKYAQHMEIGLALSSQWCDILCDDDGPGIESHELADSLQPFFRGDTARNQDAGGTGLGLAIAREGARAHGGDVILERSPPGGLRVIVRLPRAHDVRSGMDAAAGR